MLAEVYEDDKAMIDRNRKRRQEISLLSSIPKRKKRERIVNWIATTIALVFMFSVIGIFVDKLLTALCGG